MFKKTVAIGMLLASSTALAIEPALLSAYSSKTHGGAGTYNIQLFEGASVVEPRLGPEYSVVFNFNQKIVEAECYLAEGVAILQPALINQGTVTCRYSTPYTPQWISINVVVKSLGNTFGEALVRVGLLPGDVNGDCTVTLADKALVNAQVAQFVTVNNFQYDVNANGYLTVSDVGITNTRIGTYLP